MLNRSEVESVFEIILGRMPEGDAALHFHSEFPTKQELCEHLFATEEFRNRAAPYLYANGRPRWVSSEINGGLRIWLDLNDIGVSIPCLNETFEPAETTFILSQLKAGDLFIDVGANIGWYTILAAWAVGSTGHVAAFEPVLETYRYLERSVSENGFTNRCQLFPIALGATSGTTKITLHPPEHNRGHAHLVTRPVDETIFAEPPLLSEVNLSRLDEIRFPKRVAVMKIDVEGAESLVVTGGQNTIDRDKPIIVAEFFPFWLQKVSGIKGEDFMSQMSELGYKPFYLGNSGRCVPYKLSFPNQHSENYYTTIVFLASQHMHLNL